MNENKLKEMITGIINTSDSLDPTLIAGRVNRKFEGVTITPKQVETFLQGEFYNDEILKIEKRYTGYNGKIYY